MSSGIGVGGVGGNFGMGHMAPVPKDPLTAEILVHDKTHKAGTVSFEDMLVQLNALKTSTGTGATGSAGANGEAGKHINIYV